MRLLQRIATQAADAFCGIAQVIAELPPASVDHNGSQQNHQLRFGNALFFMLEQPTHYRRIAEPRSSRLVEFCLVFHQAANHHHLAAGSTNDAIGLPHAAKRQRQRLCGSEDSYAFGLIHHLADGRMDMQNNFPAIGYLRRDIQGNAGEKRRELDLGCCGRRRTGGCGTGDGGDEELIRSDLYDGFLIINGRDARTGEHLHIALSFQQFDKGVEIAGVRGNCERTPERADIVTADSAIGIGIETAGIAGDT